MQPNPDRVTKAAQRPRTVQSVIHATTLLQVIAHARGPLSLSRLARAVGLSKPATYNLLGTLMALHLLRRDAAGQYLPDWGLYEIGVRVADIEPLRDSARMPLRELARQVHGAVLLSVLHGNHVLYVDRAEDSVGFTMVADIGIRSPLHTTASGKVLLAAMSDHVLGGHLQRPLRAITPATITDPRMMLMEIALTRDHGYGVSWGEQEQDLSSVAVPLRGRDGSVCAVLAAAVPTADLQRIAPSRMAGRLSGTAAMISSSWSTSAPSSFKFCPD